MLVASMDSSATVIEWIMSELLETPQIMKNVQQELKSKVSLDRMVEESDLEGFELFRNGRFEGSNIDYRGCNFELIPFGSGRRSCPGLQLGMVVVRLVVAQTSTLFDWELPNSISPKELDMTEEFALVTTRAKHLLGVLILLQRLNLLLIRPLPHTASKSAVSHCWVLLGLLPEETPPAKWVHRGSSPVETMPSNRLQLAQSRRLGAVVQGICR
nr:cytochrome P450 CYP736A12-like [Ipomoea batatas]